MRRTILLVLLGVVVVVGFFLGSRDSKGTKQAGAGGAADARMKGAYREAPVNGWTKVHLEGTPGEIGYQHGFLLAKEILDLRKVYELELKHDDGKDWSFFRDAAKNTLWPHVEEEYRQEMAGIAEGATAAGAPMDVWDVVALNAAEEWSYYVEEWDKQHKVASLPTVTAPDHCSAFVATGSYTKDGKVVIAHNNWSNYLEGARWTMVFDIVPARGYRLLMDGLPGLIHSGDDFSINSAGIVITETTITAFSGYDMDGIPEFVRARKAMQYSASIDEAAKFFTVGNNGGYANDWLIADTRTNEIASLELGLKNVTLERKKDGYFVGSNFPINPKLAAEETHFNVKNPAESANARHKRWDTLMKDNRGKIDVAMAQKFLGDHVDSVTGKTEPSERTLCGHVDLSPRNMGTWQPAYGTAGAVQNKATDSGLAAKLSFTAAAGHACGLDFIAAKHLEAHPELGWEKPGLIDMKAQAWTVVTAK